MYRLGLVLLISCFAFSSSASAIESKPNVVAIFMDDMGYADIGPFGAEGYETPHLNRMAQEGRVFTDFYVTQAVCSASRAGLLTGCYNVRVGIGGALGPKSNIGINNDEVTLGEIAKQKGYATACYGKWHLGHHKQFLPMQNGFDDYFGLPYSNDMWPYHPGVRHLSMEERLKKWPHLPLIDGNEVVNAKVTPKDQERLTTQYTEKAVRFIERHKDDELLSKVVFDLRVEKGGVIRDELVTYKSFQTHFRKHATHESRYQTAQRTDRFSAGFRKSDGIRCVDSNPQRGSSENA